MARTNAASVKLVLLADYDTEALPDLTAFIDTATLIVDRVAACAIAREMPLTDAELEMIERWLAAHLYQQSDQGYSSRSTADASASFRGQSGMYLESTLYGQTATRIDPSGCLAAIAGGERKTARGFWLGKPERDQLSYEERNN